MGHADPVLVLTAGTAFAVGGAWLALAPERFTDTADWRGIERVLGRERTRLVMRFCGVLLALAATWLVVHTLLAP